MGVREESCFIGTCDGCGTDYQYDETTYHWPNRIDAIAHTPIDPHEDGWEKFEDGVYCPACWDWDSETGEPKLKEGVSDVA